MISLLKKAFEKAASLPEKEQDQIAQFLISVMDDEEEWEAAFARSQNELAIMAKMALCEHHETQRSGTQTLPISKEPFIGIWADREDMKDSAQRR